VLTDGGGSISQFAVKPGPVLFKPDVKRTSRYPDDTVYVCNTSKELPDIKATS
jgi:hypothetical protein